MAPTIQVIADDLGISKTTVHRALTGTGRISPKTKKKILDYAKKLDYRPNAMAQNLRAKCSMTIGLVLRGIMVGHYYSEILAGIESVAEEKGYVLHIACSGNDAKRERDIIENFCSRRVDGVIIAPVHNSKKDNYDLLSKNKIPFVFIDKYISGVKADVVTADSKTGVKEAVQLLLKTGRKKIAVLNGFEKGCVTIKERIEAYREELLRANEPFSKVIDSHFYASEDKLCGYLAMKHEIDTNPKGIDAIVCINDSLAFGALKAITESGLRVPEDIAIVGNNNDSMTKYVSPMITTISQPKKDMGHMAMNLLIRRIEDEAFTDKTGFYSLPVSLLVRGST